MERIEKDGLIEFSENGVAFAYLIAAHFSSPGVNFITDNQSEFQLGIMSRDETTPVLAHRHNLIDREVCKTSEFLNFRSGKALITLRSNEESEPLIFEVVKGDSVLFMGIGIHSVVFLEPTQLLEIKQGPYDPRLDKVYISHLDR